MHGLPSESPTLQFPEWQSALEDAMRESELSTLPERIRAATDAIFSRLKEKSQRPPGSLERIALNDAIHLLRVMRREEALSECLLGQKS
jgi:hypothetical protein